MDDSHVLSDESNSTLPSTKDEQFYDKVENEVDFDEGLVPALGKKSAEILIDIDSNRKKVITLDDDNQNLEEVFFKAITEDATFKDYVDSAVIFQIFNNKFNTWVDLDRSKELADGTHLKAIFQCKTDRGIGQCHTSKESGKKKRKYSDFSEEGSCETTTVPVCSHHISGSTQVDGQDDLKCDMKTGSTDSLWKEQVSGLNSSPTISQGELSGMSLDLSGKNPVSALHELCVRLRWEAPQFALHERSAVSAVPEFIMKVTVRGHTYIPDKPSRRKQLAKCVAAEYCLKKLGVLK